MTRLRARAPEVATVPVMATTTGALYVAGGVTALTVTASSGATGPHGALLTAIGVLVLVCGTALLGWGRRLPRAAFHVVVAGGTGLISTVVLLAPDAPSSLVLAAMYVFIIVVTFLFPWVSAAAHTTAALAGCLLTLGIRGEVPTGLVLALDTVFLAVGGVVGLLVQRASRASQDPLTGLANRRGLDDALAELLLTTGRTEEPLSAALFDVDHFKTVNDTQGHDAGDALLRAVAGHWGGSLPRRAVLARHGGDEFAVLLPGLDGEAALALVERVRAGCTAASLSCGVAEHHVGETASQLLRRADRALYQAKAAGRGSSALDEEGASPLAGDLARALERGEVRVHYQPVVSVADGRIAGVEALARWRHPRRGDVPPAEFVREAERADLIGVLGAHVLRRACAEMAAHPDAAELFLTVNVSGRELADPAYPDRVLAVLAETGWPAAQTVLEVTESVVDADSPVAAGALAVLRGHGLSVAIDDFGTGWSSLSRLDTLPADVLKIDTGMVSTVTTSPRRARLVGSIVALADALGLRLVAEGVETAEHAAVLAGLGCPFAQGWFHGRPGPLAEVLAARVERRDVVGAS